MIKQVLFITDALISPYDEGFRKFAFHLYQYFSQESVDVLSINNEIRGKKIQSIKVNKTFLNIRLIKTIKRYKTVIYMPLSSVSFFSILRASIIKLFTKNVFIIGLQEPDYRFLEKIFIKRMKKITYVIQNGFCNIELFSKVIYIESGIDKDKFFVCKDNTQKENIKKKYSIPPGKTIILHVGHIKNGRNLNDLIQIQKQVPNIQVVVVGSTSTDCDSLLMKKSIEHGLLILDKYIENITEIYQAADCYIFQVREKDHYITNPLSVLESLACGIPVITYKDSLYHRFKNLHHGIYYFDNLESIISFIKSKYYRIEGEQREEMSRFIRTHYAWDKVIEDMFNEVKTRIKK